METPRLVVDRRGDLILVLESPCVPFQGHRRAEKDQHRTRQVTPTDTLAHDLARMTTNPRVMYLVSSERLKMASRYFKTALSGRWPVEIGPDGLRRMTASEWDAEALLFVRRVIHDRPVELPLQVGRDKMARVALIVDYYGCEDALRGFVVAWWPFHVDWIRSIDYDDVSPETDNRIAFVMFVSLVFGVACEFAEVTTLAIQRRVVPLTTHNFPIPRELIDRIMAEREAAIRRIYHALARTYDKLCRGELGCSDPCRFDLMGIFVGAVDVDRYLLPGPDAIVRNCTLHELDECVQRLVDVAVSVSWSSPAALAWASTLAWDPSENDYNSIPHWGCMPINVMGGYWGLGPPLLLCEEFRKI